MTGDAESRQPGTLLSERAGLVEEVRRRRTRLEIEMTRRNVDAIVVASEANVLYLSGYHTNTWGNKARPIALIFIPGRLTVCVLSAGEAESAREHGVELEIRPYVDALLVETDGYTELEFIRAAGEEIAEILSGLGRPLRVGFELGSHFLPGLSWTSITSIGVRLGSLMHMLDATPILWSLRQTKTAFELARLRAVAQVLGEAYTRFERVAAPGSTERQLRRVFAAAAAESGADRVGYTSVVADIERGALAAPSDRRWEKGHLLMIDAGIVLDGYWADFSRIYASGAITPDQARGYRGLLESLQRGRAIVRPNISAASVVRALTEAGERQPVFGRAGHGIGLDLTEPPSLHPAEPTELRPGMSLCLEPNQLVPGIGYLAAEEEVVVTEMGCEPLSPSFPSALKVLG